MSEEKSGEIVPFVLLASTKDESGHAGLVSMQEANVAPTSPLTRLDFLEKRFLAMADPNAELDPETRAYIRTGGNLRLLLSEIIQLAPESEPDQQVDAARVTYMDTLLEKPKLRKLDEHKAEVRAAEMAYIDSVVAKIDALVSSGSPQAALALRQMPTILERAVFTDGEHMNLRNLAATDLYLLVDTALKEHEARRKAIAEHHAHNLLTRIVSNRATHIVVAGAVFAAAISPHTHILPESDAQITENIELVLKGLSATILGLETPELVRLQYLSFKHGRRTHELHDKLAENQSTADLALRIAYNATRYGSAKTGLGVTNRIGAPDKTENLRRFDLLGSEFDHLNNDPHGKPYSGEQALGYAARLLLERCDQLESIIAAGKPADQRQAEFLKLSREILVEDVIRMKKGLNDSHFRRRLIKVASVVPSVIFAHVTAILGDASNLGRDTIGTFKHGEDMDAD